MKRLLSVAVILVMLFIPIIAAAELNNVTAEGQNGTLVFKDTSGNIICAWDPANRKMYFPSGSALDVESGGYFKIAGTSVTATAAELNKLASIGAGDVITTINTKTLTNKTITDPNFTLGVTTKYLGKHEAWTASDSEAATTIIIVSSGSEGGTASIIFPATSGKFYVVRLEGGAPQLASVTIKAAGKTGVQIALNKTAIVYYDPVKADYVRVTADATNY